MSHFTLHLATNSCQVHHLGVEPGRLTLVNTGEETRTGGRLKRGREHLGDEPFCFTYGDGVSAINLGELSKFHRQHGKRATVTAIQPPGRYGALNMQGDAVTSFQEKPAGDGAWSNGGYFILDPSVIDGIEGDMTSWEGAPLMNLASGGDLMVYRQRGFWKV